MIGEGLSVNDAISKMSMVVEGYYATKNAFEISKNNIFASASNLFC